LHLSLSSPAFSLIFFRSLSALGMADSDLKKIRENAGEDKDKCKQELFKVGAVIQEMVVV